MYPYPGQQQSPVNQQQQQSQVRSGPDNQPILPSFPQAGPQQTTQAQQHQQQQNPQQQPLQGQIDPNRPEMATIHPHYPPQPYEMPRLPAPQQPYYQHAPQPYPHPPPQPAQNPNQSAPRQRTAIACKYCRRRKIRCSGFENAADGRCTNCVRFNQECVFTPVSAQTQAFVPAQAVYGRRPAGGPAQPPPQLYGPYGQPLPRGPDGYPAQQYTLPSPGHPPPPGQPYYQAYHPQGYPPPGYPPQHYEQQAAMGPGGQPLSGGRRRRASDEPHTPTLPPPNPGHTSHLAGHEQQPYGYPDPAAYAGSPAAQQQAYPGAPPGSYYPGPSQRTSPGSGYSYDQHRGSHSPHTQAPYYGQPPLQAQPAPAPPQQGRTPPPPHADARNGLAIRDIVDNSQQQGERTAADSDMVSALNRTSRR